MILCARPLSQYLAHKDEIDTAVERVLCGGRYILGDEVRSFEAEFAEYLGVTEAIAVGSGTEALHIALKAVEVGTGDEVITVSHTAVATVAAIDLCGATPVLVDIEPDYLTIDPAKLEHAVGRKTKALLPVHLYGEPADLEAILEVGRRHGIPVIEDCAQAHGALYHGRRVGSLGTIGCFSFYPTKNLGALGDGGMIVTDDMTLASQMRSMREYGWSKERVSDLPGWNSRCDELQAAILRVKLRYLDSDNAARARLAAEYDGELCQTELSLPNRRENCTHVFHLYVVRSKDRNKLHAFLQSRDVGSLMHYPVPVHAQPWYRDRVRCDSLPETERAAREVLSLPLYPQLSSSDLRIVTGAIKDFMRRAE